MQPISQPAAGAAQYRFQIFVDFWNYSLSITSVEAGFKTDWKLLPQVITAEAGALIDPKCAPIYQGMNVYGSYNDQDARDGKLRQWASNTLDRLPGVKVTFTPRQKKATGPKCPSCHGVVSACPLCSADMRGTEEKGVDTRIVTDMISLAWEGAYDAAVLVSADRDFVPVAEYLQSKGVKVIHAAFPPKGAVLSQKCWGNIALPNFRSRFKR